MSPALQSRFERLTQLKPPALPGDTYLAAGISVAIITVVNTLGSQLQSTFSNVSSQLATAGK